MKKFLGSSKIRTAVFISGTGSNLKNHIKFSLSKRSPIKINLVISNKFKASGLAFAKKNKIKKKIFEFKNNINDENKVLRYLKVNNINLICLAGFMKILSKNFIKKFNGKILNVHPSLLPKYKGLNTHYRAIKNKEKFSGCTIHFVSKKLDSGKIIVKKKVKILKKDTLKSLEKRVLKEENKLYPLVVEKLINS